MYFNGTILIIAPEKLISQKEPKQTYKPHPLPHPSLSNYLDYGPDAKYWPDAEEKSGDEYTEEDEVMAVRLAYNDEEIIIYKSDMMEAAIAEYKRDLLRWEKLCPEQNKFLKDDQYFLKLGFTEFLLFDSFEDSTCQIFNSDSDELIAQFSSIGTKMLIVYLSQVEKLNYSISHKDDDSVAFLKNFEGEIVFDKEEKVIAITPKGALPLRVDFIMPF